MDLGLRRFQRRFLSAALAPGIRTAALSLPRGNGKSTFAGYIAARVLTPTDSLFEHGAESVLIGGSIEQCRIVFRAARRILEPTGEYRFLDSATRCAITHKASDTRLRVIGSNAKTSMGLVNCPVAILDEPGAYEVNAGGLMWDAIRTAQGKPDSPLRAILIGTLAPATGGWCDRELWSCFCLDRPGPPARPLTDGRAFVATLRVPDNGDLRDRDARYRRAYRFRLRARGVCTRCQRPSEHYLCAACQTRNEVYGRGWRDQCVESGRCQRCPDPVVPGKTMCRGCLDLTAAKSRAWRAKRAAA